MFCLQSTNYNGETAARILGDSIQRIQRRRAELEARQAREEAQLRELSSEGALFMEDLQLTTVTARSPPVLAMTSPITTDERSEGTSADPAPVPVLALAPVTQSNNPIEFNTPSHQEPESGITMTSSANNSPCVEEEQDIDALIQCLEIIQGAAQVSPALESLSSFGYHSVTERKCSFDLDSNASQAGDGVEEEEEEEGPLRTAYSYSPPFTPSLDPPDRPLTHKSPKSARSKSTTSSLS